MELFVKLAQLAIYAAVPVAILEIIVKQVIFK